MELTNLDELSAAGDHAIDSNPADATLLDGRSQIRGHIFLGN